MERLTPQSAAGTVRSVPGVLVAIALVVAALYLGRIFFITLISGVLLAFILEPLVMLFNRFRIPRGVGSFLACSLLLIAIYLVGLGAWSQAIGLMDEMPAYSRRINELVDTAALRIEGWEKSATEIFVPRRLREPQAQTAPPVQPAQTAQGAAARKRRSADPPLPAPVQEVRIRQEPTNGVQWVYENLQTFYDVLLMASFVPFLLYFMLSWRDHMRRAWLNLFEGEQRDIAARAWSGIAESARAYVVGNFLLGLLLSAMSCAFFYVVKLPYWPLVGPLSGFLSLVPYIGLPLSLIPPFFVALPKYSELAPYLLIGTTTALFHLLALNLLYPKIVGARVHLNPLAVTLSLMLWYLIWGGAGLVLAIPITAGMKAVFDSIPSLRGVGRLLGD